MLCLYILQNSFWINVKELLIQENRFVYTIGCQNVLSFKRFEKVGYRL